MELLTVQETAQILKVAPITVRRYIASGRLAAVKIGRGVRIRREAIEGLLTPVVTPIGEPTGEDDPLWEIIGVADSHQVPDEAPPLAPVRDVETPGQHFLLRLAAIGDAGTREGGPSDIASDKYPYLAEIYAPDDE